MLNLDRLRALAMFATHGSIARAAQVLHVTPSGVSQQLGKLERETGHRLLEPAGRGVRLTRAGRVLAEHAHHILTQVAVAENDLAGLAEQVVGPLRLGSVGSAIRELLPTVLAAMVAEHPRLTPAIRDGEVVDLVPGLLGDELDLLLIESWVNRPASVPKGLSQRTLVSEEAWVALPARHPLSGRDRVDRAELADMAWTCCPPGTESHGALVQAFRDLGAEPDIRYAVAEYPSQLALVAAGVAIALVPAMARRQAPPGVRFVPVRPTFHREIRAAWRADGHSPAIRAFLAAIGDHLAERSPWAQPDAQAAVPLYDDRA